MINMAKPSLKVGEVSHYFTNISVAVLDLVSTLKVGDEIRVLGATTDFTQKVESMQIEHKQIDTAKAGDSIGLVVKDRVRKGDKVYLLTS
jgi:translation elongation factor EF-Tu-like GTPase